MKTLKILSIGNSFTQDPLRYLHDMGKARGVNIKCVNLVIGGCSLERHYRNMLSQKDAYSLEINGESTGFTTDLRMALASDMFDIVTIQQASHFSHMPETYYPYIEKLAEYVRLFQPNAKLYVQKTWAYENGSKRLTEELGFSTHEQMYQQANATYDDAIARIKADGAIPSGLGMKYGVEAGLKVHRDTFHASLGIGRYLLSLVWQETLLGLSSLEDHFNDFDEPVSKEDLKLVREAAHRACQHHTL